jgi:hypothetical protein
MRSVLGQVQERVPVRPMPDATIPNGSVATLKEIPYDYVATFKLQGRRSNRVQDVINISTDGAFVASTIGYSFIPAEPPPFLPIPLVNDSGELTSSTTLAEVIAQTIVNTLDLNFPQNGLTVHRDETVNRLVTVLQPIVDPSGLMRCLQVRLCGIDFKYSIIDSGTGRELQNQPIHNIAGLGEPTGDRPFRPLAKPILFAPRSTIRIEIEEVSEGAIYAGAQLFIVLHGYKALGYGTGLP